MTHPTIPKTPPVSRKLHLLLVDDEEGILESLKELFRGRFVVEAFTKPSEALERFQEVRHEIAVVDQRMPEMTGLQLCDEMKDLENDGIRILLTGYSDINTVIEALNKGLLFRYITKPWDNEELESMVMEGARQYLVGAGVPEREYPIYF